MERSISLARALSNREHARRYLRAVAALRRPIIKTIHFEGAEQFITTWHLTRSGVHKISFLFSFSNRASGYFFGVSNNGTKIFDSPVNSSHRFTQFLCAVDTPTEIRFYYHSEDHTHRINIYAIGSELVSPFLENRVANIGHENVCAAIASYPPRERMLKDAVASLLPQVDHLFIYLNNYTYVPKYLHALDSPKLHYVLDTDSTLRAAAKFFWLATHKCYWLICDDDIIYPKDYAQKMVSKLKDNADKMILGVHGTIFPEIITEYFGPENECILFAQGLARDQTVHMLGTGTVCFHSSILSHGDTARLMNYPTANDETLALICRERNIPQVAVGRAKGWLRSNPKMKFGIFEENLMSRPHSQRLTALMKLGNPWPQISRIQNLDNSAAVLANSLPEKRRFLVERFQWIGFHVRRLLSWIESKSARQREMEQFFFDAYSQNIWGGQESRSGTGSDLAQTGALIKTLPALFRSFAVKSVLDIPCGDFNWMRKVDLSGVDYTGADILDALIISNRASYSGNGVHFRKMNIIIEPLPQVDLIICRDCLVHFSYADIFRALKNIVRSRSNYLLMTSFTDQTANEDFAAVAGWRTLNFEKEPFFLPPPLQVINEGCFEGGGVFGDKSLALWRIDDIRVLVRSLG